MLVVFPTLLVLLLVPLGAVCLALSWILAGHRDGRTIALLVGSAAIAEFVIVFLAAAVAIKVTP